MNKLRSSSQAPGAGELFDEMLVIMAQSGDRSAADQLYRRWNRKLLRAARRYCGNEDAASDLAQECWLAIWKGLSGLRNPSRFRSYAFGVLYRRGADHLRKVTHERTTLSALQGTDAQPSSQSHSAAAIAQAFASLPPDQRLAAHLHFAEGLALREIAEALSIPQGTAKSRLFHARRKLKMALNPDEPQGDII